MLLIGYSDAFATLSMTNKDISKNHFLTFPVKTLAFELNGLPDDLLKETTCPTCHTASSMGPLI